MKILWLLALLRVVGGCNIISTASYLRALSALTTCIDEDIPVTINSETFLSLLTDTIDLKACLEDGNKNNCDAIIRSFLAGKSENNDLLAIYGSKLIASSSAITTCGCLQEFDAGLEQCIGVVDSYTSYCSTFYEDVGSPSNIVDGVSMCVDAIKRECDINTVEPSLNFFNQTMSCLKNNMQALQSECYSILSSLLAGIFEACGYDLATICIEESASGNPGNTLSCLLSHYSEVSPTCRSQIDYLGQNMLPCADETARFCADYSAPEDIITCLKFAMDDEDSASLFSNSCISMITSFSECLPSNDDPLVSDDDNTDDNNDNDDFYVYYYYDDSNNDDNPKPKPKPSDDDNRDDDKPKPKPRPGDDDNRDDDKPKPKPRPGDDDNRDDDKPKPKPKPKPSTDDYAGDDNAYGGHAESVHKQRNKYNLMKSQKVEKRAPKVMTKPQSFASRKLSGDGAGTPPCWAIAAGGGSRDDDNSRKPKPKPKPGSDDDSKSASNSGVDQFPDGPSDHGPASPPAIAFGLICIVAVLCTVVVWCKNGRTFANLDASKSWVLLKSSVGLSSDQYSDQNNGALYARAPTSDDSDATSAQDIELVARESDEDKSAI